MDRMADVYLIRPEAISTLLCPYINHSGYFDFPKETTSMLKSFVPTQTVSWQDFTKLDQFINSPDDSMTVTFVPSGAANPITTQIDAVCPSGVAGTDPFRLIIATNYQRISHVKISRYNTIPVYWRNKAYPRILTIHICYGPLHSSVANAHTGVRRRE